MQTVRVQLPRPHSGQGYVLDNAERFNTVMCGRRWGKTMLGVILSAVPALAGQPVGWFAPSYKLQTGAWDDVLRVLSPVVSKTNVQERIIRLVTGGSIEFWTLGDSTAGAQGSDAGRSRKYARVIIDESGLVRDLTNTWQFAIRPTLTDLRGDGYFLGTPKGRRQFFALHSRGLGGEKDWAAFSGKTIDNPHIPADEVEDARLSLPPEVFAQEYEGIPAEDGGNPFGMDAIEACVAPLDGEAVCYGVDLAKSQDWTVVWGVDARGGCCVFERWQRVPWGATEDRIVSLVGDTPTLVDETGVGSPVVERLQGRCKEVEGFHFSSTSKQQLMELLASLIQTGETSIPDGVARYEHESFEYEYTRTGVRYTAPVGLHDDCVCAHALAVEMRRRLGRFVRPGFAFADLSTPHVEDRSESGREMMARLREDPDWGFDP